ncbi:MAG: hypothetical protein F4150_07590 [Chloroflexi bacterium]|nr:hypothetical protein [Chloroflexota bacterium]
MCVEPAGAAFERRTWEAGETIDWTEGAFALETLTGRVQGYRLVSPYTEAPWDRGPRDYRVLSSSWVGARVSDRPAHLTWYPQERVYLLLDRETLQVWRWRHRSSHLAALSDDHLLFQDRRDGAFTLMTREGEIATRFSLRGVDEEQDAYSFFSPDGRTLVISVRVGSAHGGERVYRMPVTASHPEVLFEPELREGCRGITVRADYSGTWPAWGQKGSRSLLSAGWANRDPEPRMILVDVDHYCPESDEHGLERFLFSWEGDPLPVDARRFEHGSILGSAWLGQDARAEPPCGGSTSPDGRYVAWQEGFPDGHKWHGRPPEDRPWSRVVIADADTCEPVFRVLSAYTYQGLWEAQWLANSDGFVVGVRGGYAIARVDPEPGLVSLPPLPPASLWAPARTSGDGAYVDERGAILYVAPGPTPAPTGDGRYFAYGFGGMYDAVRDRWLSLGVMWPRDAWTTYLERPRDWDRVIWGETHEELRYGSGKWDREWLWEEWFGAFFDWTLVPPKLELPPFESELGFVIARTGGCADLHEQPVGAALGCLPDGTRVSLSCDTACRAGRHLLTDEDDPLVRIRTGEGLEGWVLFHHLDHE